ncbi:mediator of RNA polymerase II transcription subunit 26 isoform X2 [Oryzias melastigma]|nr:mediator of RNA polymerase II transcription subunit 26 isoform X2 [Oryzias melastigma]XP_024124356.1 mediator of RNA polymerase II transcription subunit 26 isoform X2 [Oryzias melastigma]XP_024124357.1 mediator of RNA polymerase II transcription subunit 26 isoform X2 [Oryzias melastigma]
MTTVSTTPQQIRDRLLQAIDSQSNICNMVIVLEVIACLEKYPITKEALEETRLGKLINDIRKKTKDEDLAKRAKKLLKNWQKLIEPGPVVTPGVTGSTNGSSHLCRTDPSPPDASVLGKGLTDVRMRNYVHNTYSPKAEKSSKRKVEQRDSRMHLTENLSKTSTYDNSVSPLPTNGIAASPRTQFDQDGTASPSKSRVDHLDDDKVNRISSNSDRPCPNSPGGSKLPSTSSLIKVAVIQQQARLEEEGGSYNQAKSPRSVTSSPRSQKHDSLPKRSLPFAMKGTPIPSPSSRDSPVSFSQPLASPGQPSFAEKLSHSSHRPSLHTTSLYEVSSLCPPQDTSGTLDSPSVSPLLCQQTAESHRSRLEAGFVVSDDTDRITAPNSEHKRRKYKSRDFSVNLDGQKVEDTTKRVRLKERRLTFDPVTGQIKPLVHKALSPMEVSSSPDPAEFRQRTESSVQQSAATTPGPSPNPFLQTNWKELSRNEIIQSYLNFQSNVLTSSGVHTPSAHFFMSEYLKREEQETKESKKMHVLQTDSSKGDLPGVSRQLTDKDLKRIHSQQWHGVNGCYDTNGTWFDWTECISLDPHGDENKLNILPYVCLD